MTPTLLIARREVGAYLRSLSGYVIIALVLFAIGLLFNAFALGNGERRSAEVLRDFFVYASIPTIVASILISMRLLAEERQTGTVALLYSSPVRDGEIILGKFLAALAFLSLMIACTVFMPALILVNGKISVGHLVAGYLGLLLLGSACLAIGTFGSSLARTQVMAAIASGAMVTALGCFWFLGKVAERPLGEIFTALGLHGEHFWPFSVGMIRLRDVVYYLAVSYVALFAATRTLEARRWR